MADEFTKMQRNNRFTAAFINFKMTAALTAAKLRCKIDYRRLREKAKRRTQIDQPAAIFCESGYDFKSNGIFFKLCC